MKSIRWIVSACIFLFIAGAGATMPGQSPWPSLSELQWHADIDHLAEQLPKIHPNLFHAVMPTQLEAGLDAARSAGPQSRETAIISVMRLVALIQDAHNEVEFPCGEGDATNYPLRLAWFPEGVLVEAAPKNYASLVGGTLEKIDDTPIDKAWNELLPLVSHDVNNVEGGLQSHPTIYLTCSGMLHGLGITNASESATFTVRRGGAEFQATLRPTLSWLSVVRPRTVLPADDWIEAGPSPTPLWLSHPRDILWFKYLPGERTLYAQINNILDPQKTPFAQLSRNLLDEIRKGRPQKLVLDLRRNTGGDNTLLRTLVVGLIQATSVNQPGKFFVLTSPQTYSAAQNLCNRLQLYTNAIFIGQPTADNVNFYADTARIRLANSRIEVHVAHLYWQDSDPRDRRAALYPDIAVDPSLDDYLQGKDRGLEAALTYKSEKTLEEQLEETAHIGLGRAYEAYDSFIRDPRHKYVHGIEARINTLGYKLLSQKAYTEAVVVFEINTKANPNSSNAWDSLGDGYAAAGRKSEATAAYRQSLQIDPNNADAARSLEQIKP